MSKIRTTILKSAAGAIVLTPHAVFGFTSLFLMALHFIWALAVYISDKQSGRNQFHRFSLLVWSIWMLSYISGLVSGLQKFAW